MSDLYITLLLIIALIILFYVVIKYFKAQKIILKLQSEHQDYLALKELCESLEAQKKVLTGESLELKLSLAQLETKLSETTKNALEKQQMIEESQKKLSEAFKALSQDALEKNSTSFLTLAKEVFGKFEEKTKGEMEKKEKALEGLFSPVKDSLAKLSDNMVKIEKERKGENETIKEQMKQMISSERELKDQTELLVRALRTPNVRGRWGELQLRRVVELSGMINHCDFIEQKSDLEEGRARPDMIIKLPGDRQVIVDAKTPFEAYLDAIAADDVKVKESKLKTHARHIRQHILSLGKKAYFEKFDQTPEFVVLFLPSEAFYSAALEQDPSLIEIGVDQNVILATPMTLIGLLRAIAFGWKQEKLSQCAKEIALLGKELYMRLNDMSAHFHKLGRSLGGSIDSYNKAMGSLESRVLVSARKFKSMGIGTLDEIDPAKILEQMPRKLKSYEEESKEIKP